MLQDQNFMVYGMKLKKDLKQDQTYAQKEWKFWKLLTTLLTQILDLVLDFLKCNPEDILVMIIEMILLLILSP
jgi:hypothetical protein